MAISSDHVDKLMERFVGLNVEDGRALYARLSAEDQAALDDRGLADVWAAIEAMGS
jgi:hypothetical protein